MKFSHTVTLVVATLLFAGPAVAKTPPASKVSLSGDIVTVGHYRNDSDFDPTERFDDLDGQSDAQIATFFAPRLHIDAGEGIEVFYELELGWNAWSRNDPGAPNQFLPAGADGLALRHKQAWAQWNGADATIRVGFQNYRDPTRLFLDHNSGLITANWGLGATVIQAMAGQLPDSTYEGVSIREDNFVTDSFVGGLGAVYGGDGLETQVMAYALTDERNIGRPLQLFTGVAAVSGKSGEFAYWLHGVGQTGTWGNSGIGGTEQAIGTWAAQLGVKQDLGRFSWGANVFALSADDDFDGNDLSGAFLGSGKNASRSVFLTEDETRDRYDNLDERLGSTWGPFVTDRAGLMVAELALGLKVLDGWTAHLVGAHGQALNAVNALGEDAVGTEASLLQRIALGERASIFLNGLMFAPGAAAAARVNDIDRTATATLYGVAAGMHARF